MRWIKLVSMIALAFLIGTLPVAAEATEPSINLPTIPRLLAPPSQPQGFSPYGMAITKDGEYAYVNFDLSDVVFKIRLSDLAVVATADLSTYFPTESHHPNPNLSNFR